MQKAHSMLLGERRQQFSADWWPFIFVVLIVISIPLVYVSKERVFYYWDLANFQNMASEKASCFWQSPLKAIGAIGRSLGRNYNEIFTIPLLPFVLSFGNSRVVYIISIALVYLLPFALVVGAIGVELIPVHRRAVFWVATVLMLVMPAIWAPTLRGWPDAGGALLIALALWVYVHDMNMEHWWQTVLIGFFVAGAALFRRHFTYAGVALFISMALQALIAFSVQVHQHRREAVRDLSKSVMRICLAGMASVATLVVLARPFVYYIVGRDYGVHASYERPFLVNLLFYLSQYGLVSWLLAGVGLAAGFYTRVIARPVAAFIIVFTSISLLQWGFEVRQLGAQYSLHFAIFIVLGLTALGFVVWERFDGLRRGLVLSVGAVFLLFNAANGLAPADILKFNVIRPLFSATFSPLIRSDYEEIVRLIQYMRPLASRKEPIYVAASSYDFNWDLLGNAERTLYGPDLAVLNILPTPEIDSRDGYPLATLLRAQYVIWATPFQHHLPPDEQDVAKVGFLVFKEQWQIAQDFVRLPVQFNLENGAVVNVYKRIRPTSLDVALRTLEAMRTVIGSRVNQSDWVGLSQYSRSSVVKKKDNSYHAVIRPGLNAGEPTPAFVYLGIVPAHGTITGTWVYDNEACSGRSLEISVIGRQNRIIRTAEITKRPTDPPEFAVPISTKDGVYLLLKVWGVSDNDFADCSVTIDDLRVFT